MEDLIKLILSAVVVFFTTEFLKFILCKLKSRKKENVQNAQTKLRHDSRAERQLRRK